MVLLDNFFLPDLFPILLPKTQETEMWIKKPETLATHALGYKALSGIHESSQASLEESFIPEGQWLVWVLKKRQEKMGKAGTEPVFRVLIITKLL